MTGQHANRGRAFLLGLVFLGATANVCAGLAERYRAFQLDGANVDTVPRSGPDAIAGRGDWWLSDGHLCAAVSAVEHDSGIVAGGGTLIDFGFCDRADDQWTYTNLLTGLAKEKAIRAQHIAATQSKGRAEIAVTGEDSGLRQTVRYVLDKQDPDALSMWIDIERVAPGRAVTMSGLLTVYPHRAMSAYTLSTRNSEYSLGFDHPYIDRNDVFSLVSGMMPADWSILVGSHAADAPISYGLQMVSAYLTDTEGNDHALPRFLITLPEYNLHGWMTRPLWWDSEKPGMWQMLQSQFMDLKVGERMVVHLRVVPGQHADVAAVTDQMYQGALLEGSVNAAPVSLALFNAEGQPLSQRRVSEPGRFSLRLPKGLERVKLVARSPWGEILEREQDLSQGQDLGALTFTQRSELRLPSGSPMKLTFHGVNGTPNPRIGDDLLNFREDGQPVEHSLVSQTVSLAGVESDPPSVFLPPGDYEVLASRGLEYDVSQLRVAVRPGEVSRLNIEPPKRVLDNDWASADFHVHAEASFDSTLPLLEQMRSFVAQDADILVLAEHNRIVDGQAILEGSGLEEALHLITGSELTGMARTTTVPSSIGHSNIFPVSERSDLFAGGVPQVEDRRLRSLIAETRYRYPAAIFQLNHPRSDGALDDDLAFFDHLSQGMPFEPSLPITHSRNLPLVESGPSGFRDIDFDAMEILNGDEVAAYHRILRDWLALLNQGYRIRATGNSDSHELAEFVGIPRNYLDVPKRGQGRTDAAVVEAIRKGALYLSSGPLLSVSQSGGSVIGEQLTGAEQSLDIAIAAAPWVAVDTLNVYVNGRLHSSRNVEANQAYSESIHVRRDSVVVVEVTGPATAVYRKLLPGLEPIALANPVYIDADGDGRWTAPGL
ncbi:hypothetical protein FHR99_002612 [Litorivivens lipolytica]|uniref:Uncharacterized protein n=1 Tax=Litorivivens lipolytica TaxID=1524264 RepID=A0A7W4W6D9_9GAMM|nr:CehA/McbA family metallohydrolase [Litorivivens lipolytica]MBB3048338.1 hypothetical protein [Litorivivens lipolytica]